MDKQEKRNQMEQRKQRWMEDRNRNLMKDDAVRETRRDMSRSMDLAPRKAPPPSAHGTAAGGGASQLPATGPRYSAWVRDPAMASSEQTAQLPTSGSDDVFLNKLTEKLALHIREEVQKEMHGCVSGPRAKDVVVEKMDSYLQDELQTHVCKICFEVMLSPDHTPKLLFPCGHTFCSACLTTMAAKSSRASWKCPYCRQGIESIAINQSLKELIDRFAKQKQTIQQSRANTVALDEVFPSSSNRSNSERVSSREAAPSKVSVKYRAAYQSAEMRRGILSNELQDTVAELDAVGKKKQNLLSASSHLAEVRKGVTEKIRLLNEELALIDTHLEDQKRKQEELRKQEDEASDKVRLLKKTINGIEVDMERMLLLAEGSTDS